MHWDKNKILKNKFYFVKFPNQDKMINTHPKKKNEKTESNTAN